MCTPQGRQYARGLIGGGDGAHEPDPIGFKSNKDSPIVIDDSNEDDPIVVDDSDSDDEVQEIPVRCSSIQSSMR